MVRVFIRPRLELASAIENLKMVIAWGKYIWKGVGGVQWCWQTLNGTMALLGVSSISLHAWLNLQLSSDCNIDFYTMSGPWLLPGKWGYFEGNPFWWALTSLFTWRGLPVSVCVNLPGSSPPNNGNRFVPPGIADQAPGSMDYSASIQAPDFKVDWDWKDIPLIWCVIVNGSGIETYSSLELSSIAYIQK